MSFLGGLDVVDEKLPLAVYGAVVLICGLQSVIIWPETSGRFEAMIKEIHSMGLSFIRKGGK